MANRSYKEILALADAHFDKVIAAQPQQLQCRVGCTLCCHGLFEIASADVAVIAEGLRALSPERRRAIVRRAEQRIADLDHPNLREASDREKESFFDRASDVPCPALTEEGRCEIYASRPLVCRTFGLPLREGARMLGEVCELNFLRATSGEMERAAWDLEWEDILGPEDAFTIPEAIVLADRLIRG